MAKYKVKTYYMYVATSEVKADSPEDALDKGYNHNKDVPSEKMDFIGCINSEVIDENGEIHEF
jgi:hypothetical protein